MPGWALYRLAQSTIDNQSLIARSTRIELPALQVPPCSSKKFMSRKMTYVRCRTDLAQLYAYFPNITPRSVGCKDT